MSDYVFDESCANVRRYYLPYSEIHAIMENQWSPQPPNVFYSIFKVSPSGKNIFLGEIKPGEGLGIQYEV